MPPHSQSEGTEGSKGILECTKDTMHISKDIVL